MYLFPRRMVISRGGVSFSSPPGALPSMLSAVTYSQASAQTGNILKLWFWYLNISWVSNFCQGRSAALYWLLKQNKIDLSRPSVAKEDWSWVGHCAAGAAPSPLPSLERRDTDSRKLFLLLLLLLYTWSGLPWPCRKMLGTSDTLADSFLWHRRLESKSAGFELNYSSYSKVATSQGRSLLLRGGGADSSIVQRSLPWIITKSQEENSKVGPENVWTDSSESGVAVLSERAILSFDMSCVWLQRAVQEGKERLQLSEIFKRSLGKEGSLSRGGELCRMEETKSRHSTWREAWEGQIPVRCNHKQKSPVVFN